MALVLLSGCGSVVPGKTESLVQEVETPEQIFYKVNNAMLQGDLEQALQYGCPGTELTQEQKELLQMSLDMVPQEIRDSITYTIESVVDQGAYTGIVAQMELMGETETQNVKIYHKASSANPQYCIDVTEKQDPEPEEVPEIETDLEDMEAIENNEQDQEERLDIEEMGEVNIESIDSEMSETLEEESIDK